MKMVWFKAKKYGWGWRPVTWQGWLVVLVYLALLASTFWLVNVRQHSTSDFLINFAFYFVALTLLLLSICYQTGEMHIKRNTPHTARSK